MSEQFIKVDKKRNIYYEIFGEKNGEPVFFFHGWPGSRKVGGTLDKMAKKYKVMLICPDRPGVGDSDFQENRQLLDWPQDVTRIANHLNIKKFKVLTHSGGAPYALACAYKIPHRIERMVIVNGLGIIKGERYIRPLPAYWFFRFSALMPNFINTGLNVLRFIRRKNEWFFEKAISRNKMIDSDLVEVVNALTSSYNTAFNQGTKGIIRDAVIYGSDWGFNPREIDLPISIWHGNKDRMTPLPMGRKLNRMLKNSTLHVIRKTNHALIYSRTHDIFEDLIK